MSESAPEVTVVTGDAAPDVPQPPADVPAGTERARRPFLAGLRGRGAAAARDGESSVALADADADQAPPELTTAPASDPAPDAAPAAAGAAGGATADPAAQPETPSKLGPEEVLQGWAAALSAGGTQDTLLVTGDAASRWLDLTHAHPSGLAQLLAGRPTRLGSLVRESSAHLEARRRARRIRDAAGDLAAERGIRAGYLAAGLATWRPGPLRVLDLEAGAGPVFAPVLLRGCTLRPVGPGHDDYDLDLDDDAMVNPQLLRRLAADHAVRPDGDALAGLAFGYDGFDPRRVFDALTDLCRDVPDFRIDPLLVVGTFTAGSRALLGDLEDAREVLLRHDLLGPVLRGVGGDSDDAVVPEAGRDPDPDAELLVLDLDPAQQAAVDRACSAQHLALEGPPGSGLTHTLAATVAALAARGRRVLVVTPRRATADAFLSRLEAAGLRDVVLDLHDGVGDRGAVQAALGRDLAAALDGSRVAALGVADDFTDTLHRTIRECRATLSASTSALHRKRRPWGVSAYEAMGRLAGLLAVEAPPATSVRLPAAVCERLDGPRRDAARALLRQAADAGLLAPAPDQGSWVDAAVGTAEAAEEALVAARRARDGLPRAHALMDAVAAAAGVRAVDTAAAWRPQLELLLGVRQTLDSLVPEVFERPLADLVAVTAPGGQAAAGQAAGGQAAGGQAAAGQADAAGDDGAAASGGAAGSVADDGYWARRTLRRRAKELIRPGVYVKDLHALLVAAQRQAAQWREVCPGGGRPCVPQGLAEAAAAVAEVLAGLDVLDAVFAQPGVTAPVSGLPLSRLHARLQVLADDESGVREQPQRADLVRRLTAEGLAPLVEDLRRVAAETGRPVDPDAELELAWWASVLEAIVRSDLRLARHDGHELRRAAADLRLAECAHLRDGARRVLLAVAERSAAVVAAQPQQARWLGDEVQRAHRSQWPLDLFRRAPDVVAALRPVWLMSPDAVARLLPPAALGADGVVRPVVDTIVVDDAGQVPVHEVAATLVRGAQLVVAGDRRRLPAPGEALSVLDAVAGQVPVVRLDRDHRTCDGRMVQPLLPSYPEGWRTVPGTGVTPRLRLEHVPDGVGVPGPGEDVVVSTDAEVARVVSLIADHALRRPEESLMVVTLGERHAERIKEALRAEVGERKQLRAWLEEWWTSPCREPFMVRPVGRVLGVERDDVIVSIGLGRTPHGRVLHRFGTVDGADGAALLLTGLTRARRRTTLVSCFTADDLDVERLRSPGARLLHRALVSAGEASARLRTPSGTVDVLATGAVAVPAGRGWFDALVPAEDGSVVDGPIPGVTTADPLVADLARRLAGYGVPVSASGHGGYWPPDLALGDPRVPGRLLVAVEVDGPRYAARASLRERERQRRDELERAGWTHCRVAAMDLFGDPDGEVARILAIWQTALGEGPDPLAVTDGGGSHPRGPWPDVVPGRPVAAYTDAELDAVARWVLSDGIARTEQDVAAELRGALGLRHRGARVDLAVGNAARRVVAQLSAVGVQRR